LRSHAIAQDLAGHPLLDCPLPFAWLKQITTRIANNQIELKPQTPLVRDQLRNRFEQLLFSYAFQRENKVGHLPVMQIRDHMIPN
tara:strand:+ start:8895 stop:9149 length:255 start_codon:yes stop_codon:yes gene_type:complete